MARNVTVELALRARDYITNARQSAAATEDLTDAQRALAAQAGATAAQMTRAGQSNQRALLYSAAGVAALGAAGGALNALPGLLAATGASAAVLPGILGATAADAIVLKLAVAGVGEAIGQVYQADDPFSRLSPSAKALVAETGRVKETMLAFQQQIQNNALDGAAANLNAFATRTLPAVDDGLYRLASTWSATFREITAATMDPQVQGAFNLVTASANTFLDDLNARIQPLAGTVSTLVTAADPLVRMVGEKMVGALDSLIGKIEQARASGDLAEFFDNGTDAAAGLLSIGGNVARIIGMVVAEANKQASVFADGAAQLREYVKSGEAAEDVAGIMRTLTAASEGLMNVVGPLGVILREAFADPATAQALETVLRTIASGTTVALGLFNVLDGLFDVINAIGSTVGISGLGDTLQAAALSAVVLALASGKVVTSMAAVSAAVARTRAQLTGLGADSGKAAGRMSGVVGVAGRVAGALFALNAASALVASTQKGLNPQIDALGSGLATFGREGIVAGEAARLLGGDLGKLDGKFQVFADESSNRAGAVRVIQGALESLVPGLAGTDTSLTRTAERVGAMDTALAGLVQNGQTEAARASFERLAAQFATNGVSLDEFKAKFPEYAAAVEQAAARTGASGAASAAAAERTALLAGSFREAALAGKDLATTMGILNGANLDALGAEIAVEEAIDNATAAISKNGAVVKKGTNEIDLSNKKGRENAAGLKSIADAAIAAADAENKRTGTMTAGIPVLESYRSQFIKIATAATGSRSAAVRLANQVLRMPDKDIKLTARTDNAVARLEQLGFKVKRLPDGRIKVDTQDRAALAKLAKLGFTTKRLPDGTIAVIAKTDAAKARLAEARRILDNLNGKTATTYVVTKRNFIGPVMPGSPFSKAQGGVVIPRQRGGVSLPGGVTAAAGGLLRPEYRPAGTRPMYQWAEPETGGELFLPRRGIDRQRGRELLEVAAEWYGGKFIAMARGGIRGPVAAARGLVNMAPAETTDTGPRATRLDVAESYLEAANAVKALSVSLKENGRQFSVATAKGRENRAAVFSVIRSAQDAAKTKFEETGSVRAANLAYDAHIGRLRAVLAQQRVSAAQRRALLALAGRPDYDTGAVVRPPANSVNNVSFARAVIGASDGIGELRDNLSLYKPVADFRSKESRANLTGILDYLDSAGQAAQARFTQTGNARLATALYTQYVNELRRQLAGNGFNRSQINDLVRAYGRITLQRNQAGGVYQPAREGVMSLNTGGVYPGGRTLYGFAEPGTGGELFLPRVGQTRRGRDLVDIGAGWYGGRVTWPGQGGRGGETHNHMHLHVNPRTADFSMGQFDGYVRQLESHYRVGRKS